MFNILLQVLDNGRLTDGKGKIVNFKNAIIIMTSNVGSHYFKSLSTLGFAGIVPGTEAERQEADFKAKVQESLRETFKPEFLNRVDDIVVFNSLKRADIARIVELQLQEVLGRLRARGITATVDPTAIQYIVDHGFDPEYGARPIRRLIQKMILDKLADGLIRGTIKEGKSITISVADSSFRFTP